MRKMERFKCGMYVIAKKDCDEHFKDELWTEGSLADDYTRQLEKLIDIIGETKFLSEIITILYKNKIYLRDGDLVRIETINYRNDLVMVYSHNYCGGEKLTFLDFAIDEYGSIPSDFSTPNYPIDYWDEHITHNSYRWLDDSLRREVVKNITLDVPEPYTTQGKKAIAGKDLTSIDNQQFCSKITVHSFVGGILVSKNFTVLFESDGIPMTIDRLDLTRHQLMVRGPLLVSAYGGGDVYQGSDILVYNTSV